MLGRHSAQAIGWRDVAPWAQALGDRNSSDTGCKGYGLFFTSSEASDKAALVFQDCTAKNGFDCILASQLWTGWSGACYLCSCSTGAHEGGAQNVPCYMCVLRTVQCSKPAQCITLMFAHCQSKGQFLLGGLGGLDLHQQTTHRTT